MIDCFGSVKEADFKGQGDDSIGNLCLSMMFCPHSTAVVLATCTFTRVQILSTCTWKQCTCT